jgi:hypothetical protein
LLRNKKPETKPEKPKTEENRVIEKGRGLNRILKSIHYFGPPFSILPLPFEIDNPVHPANPVNPVEYICKKVAILSFPRTRPRPIFALSF